MNEHVGHFDICKEMARRGLDIRLSLLDNIESISYSAKRDGTKIVIGFPGNVVTDIALGKFLGGLLLCNTEQYRQVAKELRESEPIPASTPEENGK